jgi:hypothetical protein
MKTYNIVWCISAVLMVLAIHSKDLGWIVIVGLFYSLWTILTTFVWMSRISDSR